METPKAKVPRFGFREFIRQQRKLHSPGTLSPVPTFEIKLPETLHQDGAFEEMPPIETISIVCGDEGGENKAIVIAPKDAMVGCSRWFYDLFETQKKDIWSDSKTGLIHLPGMTKPVIEAVVEFAKQEKRVNPDQSFLKMPPQTDCDWSSGTKSLSFLSLARMQRTTFQFTVAPDMALDLCHAALFFEMPALLDVACRMVAHYVDFLAGMDGLDPRIVFHICAHIEPLKLAVLEQEPQLAPYVGDFTPIWTAHCTRASLEPRNAIVAFSWLRYRPDLLDASLLPSSRQLFIHNALRIDLGKLSSEYKMKKKELDAGSLQTTSYSAVPQLVPYCRTPVSLTSSSHSRTENEEGIRVVTTLSDLAVLSPAVRCVSLSLPLDLPSFQLLQQVVTLELKGLSLWSGLPFALPSLKNLRHLVLDELDLEEPTCYARHIYWSNQFRRHEFDVPPKWPDLSEEAKLEGKRDVEFISESSPLLFLLDVFIASSQLPNLETFQFCNPYWPQYTQRTDPWDLVLASHWKPLDAPCFYPNLRNLSLSGCSITAKTLSFVLYAFRTCKQVEILDLSANHLPLVSPSINWTYLREWLNLKHLFLGMNTMSTTAVPSIYAVEMGKSFPAGLKTLGLDQLSGSFGYLAPLWEGIGRNGVQSIEEIILQHSSGAKEVLEALSQNASVLAPSLAILDLTASRLTDTAIPYLERLLFNTPTLSTIKLCSKDFTLDGLERLITILSREEHSHIQVSWTEPHHHHILQFMHRINIR